MRLIGGEHEMIQTGISVSHEKLSVYLRLIIERVRSRRDRYKRLQGIALLTMGYNTVCPAFTVKSLNAVIVG